MKRTEIQKESDDEWEDQVLVKIRRTKKWGLYQIYHCSDEDDTDWEEIIPAKFDSLGFFTEEPIVIVKEGKKHGILLNPYEIGEAAERVNCRYDEIQIKKKDGAYFTLLRLGDRWGLVDWFKEFYVVDPVFDRAVDVPLIQMDYWMTELSREARKALKADLIEFDYGNGDGVFRARNNVSKKCGMYQSIASDQPTEMIPMEYDSAYFFPFNGNYTAVFNSGKVGFTFPGGPMKIRHVNLCHASMTTTSDTVLMLFLDWLPNEATTGAGSIG